MHSNETTSKLNDDSLAKSALCIQYLHIVAHRFTSNKLFLAFLYIGLQNVIIFHLQNSK